ncbi:TonB-dependent receptor [Rhizorhabdus wittichii]|uniref:TonB-dependent receptor n=1 Tax=Rhizorhabdus wittichii TaxID=160791 RepID=A0A975D147_9SPHN|nr:TonB-dependent receptor [Rhizorhabdus wittichii]QTH20934.1 TonB-dependent receptor [Rhizorhabdus wittichii]
MRLHHLFAAAAVAAIATGSAQAQTAPAADADNIGLEEIVVTAQKRSEKLQDIPVTVTALGAEALERRQVLSVSDLQSIAPGVSVGQHAGYNRLFIRGIGLTSISSGQDPSVSFQVDGVVIGRPSAQLASFFDLERVEVLRGPQGTLYGRNATGGSVNLITRKPTRDLSGYLDLTYGNYDRIQLDGAISGPLDGKGDVRARIAFQKVKHDGYGRNVTLNEDVSDQDSWAVRGILQVDPAANVDITLSADYAREDDHNYPFNGFGPYRSDVPMPGLLLGGTLLPNSRDVTTEVPTRNDRTFWGLSGTIGVDLGGGLRFQSITGYRKSRRANINDPETTSYAVFSPTLTAENARQFSQELQLLYTSDRLNGVAGLFYYDESLKAELDLGFPVIGAALGFPAADYHEDGTIDIKAYAAFTQWTYEVVDHLRLTAGVRYSDEKRRSNGTFTIFSFMPPPNAANVVVPVHVDKSWHALTPKFSIDYKPVENVMLYASATRGFKSGVLLSGNPNPPVNPEYIWSYEAGIKSSFLDNRVQLNAAAFYYDFKDLQVNRIINVSIVTENAAAARVKGAEVELRARPVEGVTLNADATYLDATFRKYSTKHPARPELGLLDLSGNRLANAPKWSLNAGAEFDLPIGVPGRLSARGDVAWTGKVYFTEFNENLLSQDAVATVDASLQYESEDGHWRASLFGKNLTNRKIVANKFIAAQTTGFALNGGFKPPRTYGLRVGYRL